MNKAEGYKRIYVVVDVVCGLANNAYSFLRRTDAVKCFRQLQKERNLNDDDVQIIETDLGSFPEVEALNA